MKKWLAQRSSALRHRAYGASRFRGLRAYRCSSPLPSPNSLCAFVAPSAPVLSNCEPLSLSLRCYCLCFFPPLLLPLPAPASMVSAAAVAFTLPVGVIQSRGQLPSFRPRLCRSGKLFLSTSGAGYHGYRSQRGGGQLGLRVPCSGKGRGESGSGVLDGARRGEALEGGDMAAEEEDEGEGGGEVGGNLVGGGDGEVLGKWRPPWELLPQRYKLIGTASLAFVICNMDKVNLSIAIIPMSHEFGWNSSIAGLVQSSFFWGYALSQLPGGWLAKLFGGRKVQEIGVLGWSLATMLVPLVAGFMPGLALSRVLVGIGEGVSPSAATDLIARSIPLEERSRAVGIVFGGLSVGSVLGLLLAPPIIQNFGWESVFYIFGFLGLLWCLGLEFVDGQSSFDGENKFSMRGKTPSAIVSPSSISLSGTKSWNASLGSLGESLKDVPWEPFFRSPAVWAMIYAHFCGSWGHYTCLSWLPTYFSEELDLNLTEAAWVSVLPPLGSILITSLASTFADSLISRGVETTTVRKICQTIAFLSPAVCMTLSSLDFGLPPWEIVAFLTGGLALSSFALSGLYCTHQDISPEYASVLLGITNTVGAVPGIIGVSLTGYLLDSTHSWSLSLFAPSIFFYLTGTIVWLVFASSKPQSFSKRES